MLVVALGAAAALFALAALLLFAAGRARARALAEDIREKVEPYLRRKAAEAGIGAQAPTWTSRTAPEEIISYSARLSGRLLDHERTGPAIPTSESLEYARTQPVSSSDELIIRSKP
jgi:hypothetical protein